MSLSKKKYCFNRRKSDSKGSTDINQEKPIKNSYNDGIKEINKILNYNEESIDNLKCQTNNKENNNKDLISQIPLPTSKNKNNCENDKKDEIDLNNNPELLYLINKNETENIDFINTLLKLKGITTGTSNTAKIINFENNILLPKNAKYNEINISNNKNISNKSIPSNCSTSTSKINTINYNNHQNNNEEEIFDMINNINKTNYKEIKTNLTKEIKNIPLNGMITILDKETEKKKCFLKNINKETVSSFECNTNKSTSKQMNRNEDEFIYSKEHYKNIKNPKTFSNNIANIFEEKNIIKNNKRNKGIIPINNKSFYKKSVSNKNFTCIQNQKIVDKNKEQVNISTENKILNKRSVKRIPHIKKNNYALNNINNINSKNNSKERKSNSKNSHNDKKSNKKESSKKSNSKNKTDSKKSRNNSNKKIKINENETNNISLIKMQKNGEKNNIINNSQKSEKRLTFEPKEIDNISTKKEEIKNMSEKIMEIDLNELRNNYQKNFKFKQIKKNQINNLINRNNPNNEYLKYNIPFNSERKIAKIFQLGDKICDKTEISPNRINNISYLNSKFEGNNGFFTKLNVDNMNSYVKLAKNKYLISPSLKNKNKRFINNFNNSTDDDESLYKKNKIFKSNFSCNNMIISNNIVINENNINKNQKRKSENINILNNANIIFSDKKNKKSSKLMNKLEENGSSLIKDNNFNINHIDKEGINDNDLQEITISKKKEFYNNSKTYKKQNDLKVAEIFLFDKEEVNSDKKNNI